MGKHSEEAAEERGEWFRWHDGSEVGVSPGFYCGGKSAHEPTYHHQEDVIGFCGDMRHPWGCQDE
jgi:hypothetical protein